MGIVSLHSHTDKEPSIISFNMRIAIWILVVYLAVAVVEGQKGGGKEGKGKGKPGNENPPEPRGFCIDQQKVVAICMAGSAMEEKANATWESCETKCEGYMSSSVFSWLEKEKSPQKEIEKEKKPGKGKGKKPSSCPTVRQIMEKTKEKFACEICHFTAMGWIDNDRVADEHAIEDDIMSLPNEISE